MILGMLLPMTDKSIQINSNTQNSLLTYLKPDMLFREINGGVMLLGYTWRNYFFIS